MALGTVNVGQAPVEQNNGLTTEVVGVPGGLATLDGDGKLTASQRPTVDCYTKAQADAKVAAAVESHDGSSAAHSDIRASVDALQASIQAIELKYGTNVTQNPFTVSFTSLNDVVVTGVWNASQGRIEF